MTTLTIDPMLMADLSATCNSLGYLDDATGKYQKEPECLECVKDLVRFLRRDDENHEIRRALGETKVVVKDLIPIIKHHAGDAELLDVTLRLLVNLTTPALVLYEEELPGERVSRRYYIEVIQYLQTYKEAFSDKVFWEVLTRRMAALLEKDWDSRMEDDRLMVERIMILVRNVLHIPANPAAEKRTDDDASVHDQVLWAMHLATLDDIILFMAQSDDEQHLCMHVLEVVSLMLREQDAKQLARSGAARSQQERNKDIQELDRFRQQEQEAKQKKAERLSNLRHTRFGGTYTVQNMRSISERALIYHQPLSHISQLSFDKDKVPRKTPKNRLPLSDGDVARRSMLTIRLFLKQFCAEFLEGAYNKIMANVKDDLARAKAQANDESYYMWAVKFFMEFNRYNGSFKLGRITETLSVSMFHYLQTQMESYLEMMTVEKRKIRIWSKRAHLALRAYQELLFTIQHLDSVREEGVREAGKVLKSNLFYMPEYRELLYVLLCKYDPIKMSRKFLTDLVETTHVFIRLLERFSRGGRVVVKQKSKARRKSKPKRPAGGTAAAPGAPPPPDPEPAWDGLVDELSAAVLGERELPQDVRPFDAASEVPMHEQRTEAMLRVQDHLRAGRPTEALALLRAAREVWPEGDAFGAADIAAEDEFLALREIHFAELPGRAQEQEQEQEQPAAEQDDPQPQSPDDEEDGEDEEEIVQENREQEFDFKEFIQRFMSPKVLEPYCALLRHFDTNSPAANHCVIKMLHRVAWNHSMPAMLFQVSLFRTFQRLMDEPRHYRNPAFKDIVNLAKFVLSKFFQMAATNKKIFMELLFWKTPREAYELEHGYDSYKETSKATKLAWSEEEEMELQRVYEELKDAEPDPERDLVDRILDTLICRERSRRQVIKKLKELGVVTDTRQLSGPRRGVRLPAPEWTEQEVANLTELWNRFREGAAPVDRIWEQLSVRRPKNRIREKLKQLGLMKSRRRRRDRGDAQPAGDGMEDGGVVDSSSSDDEDDGPVGSGGPSSGGGGAVRRPSANPRHRRRQGQAHRRPAVRQATAGQLAAAVRDYRQTAGEETSGEVLLWLQESLQELEQLRRDDPEEAVPLVPLSEAAAIALESDTGLKLVSLLGAQKPAEGEMFWRWPVETDTDTFLRNAAVLGDCLAGTGPPPDDEASSGKENVPPEPDLASSGDEEPPRTASSDDEEPPRTASSRRSRLVSSGEESGDEQPGSPAERSQPSGRRSPSVSGSTSGRRRVVSDPEEETPQTATGRTQRSRRARVVTSDSEDDVTTESVTGKTPLTQRSRASRVTSDSEGEPSQDSSRRGPSQTASGSPLTTQRGRGSRMASDSEGDAPSRTRSGASARSPSQATSGSTPSTQRSRVARVTSNSSDSEGETSQATSRQSLSQAASPSTQRGGVSRVSSDSEDGAEPVQETGEPQLKRMLSSDEGGSDGESRKPAGGGHKKARRVIDSDSD